MKTLWSTSSPLTHSLTHCCAWPARAVATATTSDPAPMTTASRLCSRDPLPPVVSWSSLVGQVDASSRGRASATQCWRMLWAGTSGGRRQTCPSNECLLSAMMKGRSVSFVWFRTESLVTKSYHLMFRMCRCAFMWKACSQTESAWSESTSQIHAASRIEQRTCRVSVSPHSVQLT